MVPPQDGVVKHWVHGTPCSDARLLAPPVILLEDGSGHQGDGDALHNCESSSIAPLFLKPDTGLVVGSWIFPLRVLLRVAPSRRWLQR